MHRKISISDCYKQNNKEPSQGFQKYVDDIHFHDSLHNLLGADMVDVHGRLHIGGSETINDNRLRDQSGELFQEDVLQLYRHFVVSNAY